MTETQRAAMQQALEALEHYVENKRPIHRKHKIVAALRAALAEPEQEPVLQTCNCRWDGAVQVQQCTLHGAHVDAIHEWAERAKAAERKLAQLAEPEPQNQSEESLDMVKANRCWSLQSAAYLALDELYCGEAPPNARQQAAAEALRAALAEQEQGRKKRKPKNSTTPLGIVCFEAYARSEVGSNRWDIAAEAVRAALAASEANEGRDE